MNEEGYLWITDRLKELIKYKGNQVPPAQLEAVILTHPSVQDCAVIGIPDESAGELPRAYVKVKESFEGKVTEGELQAFVKGYKLQIRQNIFSIRFEIKTSKVAFFWRAFPLEIALCWRQKRHYKIFRVGRLEGKGDRIFP